MVESQKANTRSPRVTVRVGPKVNTRLPQGVTALCTARVEDQLIAEGYVHTVLSDTETHNTLPTPSPFRRPKRPRTPRQKLPKKDSLKVVQINVAKGLQKLESALQSAAEIGADVVCVQEPWLLDLGPSYQTQTRSHPAFSTILPPTGSPPEPSNPKVATYVAKHVPVNVTACLTTRLTVEVRGVKVVNFYRQHSSTTPSSFTKSLPHLPRNTLMVGDCNLHHPAWEEKPTGRLNGQALVNYAVDNLVHISKTGPTHASGSTIDVAMYSHDLVATSRVAGELDCGSDHLPVVTEVRVANRRPRCQKQQYHVPRNEDTGPGPYRPTREETKFVQLVQRLVDSSPEPPSGVEEDAKDLQQILEYAVRSAGSKKRGRRAKRFAWWSEECLRARTQFHAQERSRAARKEYESILRKEKARYFDRQASKVTDGPALWHTLKWTKPSLSHVVPPLAWEGRIVTDETEKYDLIHQTLCNPNGPDKDTDRIVNPPGVHVPWDLTCTMAEATRSCVGVQSTSPGPDSLTVHLLKLVWHLIVYRVTRLYQKCLVQGKFPQAWKTANVTLLTKKGKDPQVPRNRRPISLLPVLGKGLERLVARRIGHSTVTYSLAHPHQGGFLPYHCTTDLLGIAHHELQDAKRNKEHSALVCHDVEGAYNAILPNRMANHMVEAFFPEPAVSLVHSWMTNRSSTLPDGVERSHSCGLPQGSPLSPVLFTLYMTPAMYAQPRGCTPLNYADDLATVVRAKTATDLVGKVQETMSSLQQWADGAGVTLDPKKTEVLLVPGTRNASLPECIPATEWSPKVVTATAVKWLGVTFNNKLSPVQHASEVASRAAGTVALLKRMNRLTGGIGIRAGTLAIKTMVLPKVMYAAPAWMPGTGTKTLDILDVLVRKATRATLPVVNNMKIGHLHQVTQVPQTANSLATAVESYARRVERLPHLHAVRLARLKLQNQTTQPTECLKCKTKHTTETVAECPSLTCLERVLRTQPSPKPKPKKPPDDHHLPRESARALWAEVTGSGRWTAYLEKLKDPPDHRLCQCGETNRAGHVLECVLSPPRMNTNHVPSWHRAWKRRQEALGLLCKVDRETEGRWTLEPRGGAEPQEPRPQDLEPKGPETPYNYWTSNTSPGPAVHKTLNEETNQETRHRLELQKYREVMERADVPWSDKGKWWPYGHAFQKTSREKHRWC